MLKKGYSSLSSVRMETKKGEGGGGLECFPNSASLPISPLPITASIQCFKVDGSIITQEESKDLQSLNSPWCGGPSSLQGSSLHAGSEDDLHKIKLDSNSHTEKESEYEGIHLGGGQGTGAVAHEDGGVAHEDGGTGTTSNAAPKPEEELIAKHANMEERGQSVPLLEGGPDGAPDDNDTIR